MKREERISGWGYINSIERYTYMLYLLWSLQPRGVLWRLTTSGIAGCGGQVLFVMAPVEAA
jgi:hypothetical protein